MTPRTLGVLTFDKKGRTTFNGRMRRELQIDEESYVVVQRTEDGTIQLVPAALIPKDQLWFHHPEMQARIAEAEADIAAGRVTVTRTIEEAQALLDSLKKPSPQPGCGRIGGETRRPAQYNLD